MGIKKLIQEPSGKDCEYWKITNIHINNTNGPGRAVNISVLGYKNKAVKDKSEDYNLQSATFSYPIANLDMKKGIFPECYKEMKKEKCFEGATDVME